MYNERASEKTLFDRFHSHSSDCVTPRIAFQWWSSPTVCLYMRLDIGLMELCIAILSIWCVSTARFPSLCPSPKWSYELPIYRYLCTCVHRHQTGGLIICSTLCQSQPSSACTLYMARQWVSNGRANERTNGEKKHPNERTRTNTEYLNFFNGF